MKSKRKTKKNYSIIKIMQEWQQNKTNDQQKTTNKELLDKQGIEFPQNKDRNCNHKIHIAGIASRFYCMSNAQLVCQRNIR
jgi:hypothetical protein